MQAKHTWLLGRSLWGEAQPMPLLWPTAFPWHEETNQEGGSKRRTTIWECPFCFGLGWEGQGSDVLGGFTKPGTKVFVGANGRLLDLFKQGATAWGSHFKASPCKDPGRPSSDAQRPERNRRVSLSFLGASP